MYQNFGNKDLFLLFTCDPGNIGIDDCITTRSSRFELALGLGLSTIKSIEMRTTNTPYFSFDPSGSNTGFGHEFNSLGFPNTMCVCYRPFRDKRTQDFGSLGVYDMLLTDGGGTKKSFVITSSIADEDTVGIRSQYPSDPDLAILPTE
jgi:hypothetical protein